MEVWSVLGLSLLVDGYVLVKTFESIWQSKPKNLSLKKHLTNVSQGALAQLEQCLLVVLPSDYLRNARDFPRFFCRTEEFNTSPSTIMVMVISRMGSLL